MKTGTTTICMLGFLGTVSQTEGKELLKKMKPIGTDKLARGFTTQYVYDPCTTMDYYNLDLAYETTMSHVFSETLPWCTLVQQYCDYSYHVVSSTCKAALDQECIQYDIPYYRAEGCYEFHCPKISDCCTPCPIGTCRKNECDCTASCSTSNCFDTHFNPTPQPSVPAPTPRPTRACSSSESDMMNAVVDSLFEEYGKENCEVLDLFYVKLQDLIDVNLFSPLCYNYERGECVSDVEKLQRDCPDFSCPEEIMTNGAFVNSFSVILFLIFIVSINL